MTVFDNFQPESFYQEMIEDETFDLTEEDMQEELSDCCTAPIIHGDICSQCLEHI